MKSIVKMSCVEFDVNLSWCGLSFLLHSGLKGRLTRCPLWWPPLLFYSVLLLVEGRDCTRSTCSLVRVLWLSALPLLSGVGSERQQHPFAVTKRINRSWKGWLQYCRRTKIVDILLKKDMQWSLTDRPKRQNSSSSSSNTNSDTLLMIISVTTTVIT